jgi:hypothetical protein
MTYVVVSQFTGDDERCDVFESGSGVMCHQVYGALKDYWVSWQEAGYESGFWGVYMDKRLSPDSIIRLNPDGSVAHFRCVESERILTYDQDIHMGRD